MHCVSRSETWGRAGSSSHDGITVAHPGNRSDSWRQCESSHPSPTTLCPRRSDIPPFTLNDHSQVRPGLPICVARSCVTGTLSANDRAAMATVSGGVGELMADDANGRGLAVPPIPEAAQRRMLERVPFAVARNPVDVTG